MANSRENLLGISLEKNEAESSACTKIMHKEDNIVISASDTHITVP